MERYFTRFISDDAGKSSADWLVLTVGILMLASAIIGTVPVAGDKTAASDSSAVRATLI